MKIIVVEKLYEKYLLEHSHNALLEDIEFVRFQEMVNDKLSNMECIRIDDGAKGQGVLYYSLWREDSIQICNVPVYGYWVSSEKILSKLFCKLSDEIIKNGDAQFQINLYAHDREALKLFSMMQFGYMSEKGRLEIDSPHHCFSEEYTIKTLEKDEIEERWNEIWELTNSIVCHLKRAPIFYPGHEFTEQVYKEFFMDSETSLHIAFSKNNKMIGMIESNCESDLFDFQKKSVNVGEIYVIPEYRGTTLSKDLLQFVADYEKQQGANYLWVVHGTANPNARGFWNKYFRTYQYELVRKIEKN